jgi:hypothetical protein
MMTVPQAASAPECELKFLLRPGSTAAALATLRSLCRADGAYPENDVITIYYDTADLESLGDKLASHRFKTKLRLRWYESRTGDTGNGRGFLELKFRMDSHRRKLRTRTPYRASWLQRAELDDVELLRAPEHLRPLGLIPPAGVRPVLEVRYRRCRFVEPFSGSRISLDWSIRAARVNRQLLPVAAGRGVSTTVLEIKNPTGVVPAVLRRQPLLRGRRSSFSKYSACYEAMVA